MEHSVREDSVLDREKRPRCCGRVGNTECRGQGLGERASRLGEGKGGHWTGQGGKDSVGRTVGEG